MKIAVFHNLPAGGAKRVIFQQIKYLSQNHQIILFTLSENKEKFLNLKPLVKKTYTYKFKLKRSLPGFLGRLQQDYQNFIVLKKVHQQIARDIDSQKFAAVLVHPDKYTQAPFLLSYLKTKSIYYCHEWLRIAYEPELKFNQKVGVLKQAYEALTRKIRRQIDKFNAQKASLIFANSRYTQKNIYSAYGKKALVCYPGVDVSVFKPLKLKRQNLSLFIGSKSFINDYNLAAQALKLVKKDLRPKFKIIAFKNNQPQLSDQQLVKQYAQAKFTFCLGLNEPFGLTAIESMACATPVIALNQGGYKETVKHKQTGYLVGKNPQQIADFVIKLIENPTLSDKLGRQGLKHIKSAWTWKKHYQILNHQLKKITAL